MKNKRLLVTTCLIVAVVFFASEIIGFPADPVKAQPNQMVFRLVSLDPSIKIPPENDPSNKSLVRGPWEFTGTSFSDGAFVLRMTNGSTARQAFCFYDTWRVVVVAVDGHTLQYKDGRDATRPPGRSDFEDARPTETVNFPISYKLSHDEQGKLVLWGYDGLGGIWGCGPISPGKYRVHVEYGFAPTSANTLWHDIDYEKLGIETSSLWQGDGKTNEVELEVR